MFLRTSRSRRFARAFALGLCAVAVCSGLVIAQETVAPQPAGAVQNPQTCQNAIGLVNGGMEQPRIPDLTFRTPLAEQVPGWQTTDGRGAIELWSTGYNRVFAPAGRQFAELNAYTASRLYQDLPTTPGQSLTWSLQHRGRAGVDTMRVVIGPPGGTLAPSGPDLSDGNTAWGRHSGTYVVPAGQTLTRFGFEAVSAAGGNPSIGNFLDDISFGTGPCVVSTKSVINVTDPGASAEVGDVLRYTVTMSSEGGNPALAAVATDTVRPGQEYIPRSLRITGGVGAGALTDAAGDDRGEYSPATRAVRIRLGDGATAIQGGSLSVGAVTSFSFDARVTMAGAGATLENEATLTYEDPVVTGARTSTSNTTEVPVDPIADVGVSKTLDTDPVVAGAPVTYTITATNEGPNTATGVRITDSLPAGLSGARVDGVGANCTVTSTIDCDVPNIAVGGVYRLRVTADSDAGLDPGTAMVNTAMISAAPSDPDASDNVAAASGTTISSADVSIAKRFEPDTPVAGSDATYRLLVRNDGPSVARDVVIADPIDPTLTLVSATLAGVDCPVESGVVRCDVGTLEPGRTAEAVIVVSLPADRTAAVQNTAFVTSSTTDPDPLDNTSSAAYDPAIVTDLSVTKTASAARVAAGESVDFTLSVSDLGPSDAKGIALDDTLPDGFSVTSVDAPAGATCQVVDGRSVRCAWDDLPASSPSVVVVHALVSPDAPAGTVTNTASVAAPASDTDTSNNSASADVEVVTSADLSIRKRAEGTAVPGRDLTYAIDVSNAGPSTARGIVVSDTLPDGFEYSSDDAGCTVADGAVVCDVGSLDPAGTTTLRITGRLIPGLKGDVQNSATVTSATPDPDPSDDTATATSTAAPLADVSVRKLTSTPTAPRGEPLAFTVVVRNDGPSVAEAVVVRESPQFGLAITDATPSAGTWSRADWTWLVGSLQPGEEATLVVEATSTTEGALANTVDATSATPDPDAADRTASVTVQVTPIADVSVQKTISVSTAPVNSEVTYTIRGRNDGPSTAVNVVVADELPAELIDATTATTGCTITGRDLVCDLGDLADQAVYEIRVNGRIDPATGIATLGNTARVASDTPDPDAGDNTSTVTVPVTGAPRVELVKRGAVPVDVDGDDRIGAGDAIDYTFTIRNIGEVTLTGALLTDPLLGGDVPCAAFATPLQPGEEVSCAPARYSLTQDDVDAGVVANTASITAQSARGEATDDASVTVIVPAVDSVALQKSPQSVNDLDGDGATGAGDSVTYTFAVINTGTTTLRGARIVDPMLGGAVTCSALEGAVLAPGDSIACDPVDYTLTQGDVDRGQVHNEAEVTADAPNREVTDVAQADATTTGTATIVLIKTAGAVVDVNGDGVVGAGDTIDYRLSVRNAGTTTLTSISISDAMLGAGPVCTPAGPLAPGAEAPCTVRTYALTQQDIESGVVENTAEATATSPLGAVRDPASADVVITGSPGVELTKVPGEPVAGEDGMVGRGDPVGYTFTVRNTGTTLLRDIEIDDPLLGGRVDCPAFDGLALAPQQEVTCGPVDYALTQADVEAALVHNEAAVAAASVAGPVDARAEADVEVTGTDRVALLKSAAAAQDADGSGRIDAGDTIAYTFAVTNTGTTTLRGIQVTDQRLDGDVVCDRTELLPGEVTVCTGPDAVLTADEIEADRIVNTATVTATGLGDDAVTAQHTIATPLRVQRSIALQKSGGDYRDANGDGRVSAGDTVAFRFTVTNTGVTILTAPVIDDPALGGRLDCDLPDLAPGESADCGPVTYALTRADVAAGRVVNVATVSAGSVGGAVTAAATATVEVAALAVTGGTIGAIALVVGGMLLIAGVVMMRRRRLTRHG